MVRAKNYESMSTLMEKKLWPLFSGHGVLGLSVSQTVVKTCRGNAGLPLIGGHTCESDTSTGYYPAEASARTRYETAKTYYESAKKVQYKRKLKVKCKKNCSLYTS